VTPIFAFIGAVIGASIGSFLACVAYRIPRRISISGRSFCDSCGAVIPGYLNVPLVGFLLLRGRSRCCHERLPVQMFVWEAFCACVGAAVCAISSVRTTDAATALWRGPLSLLAFAVAAMLVASVVSAFRR
jgi:leader peptidase (prepilin peptidase)/N-methyltransferase